MRVYLYVVLKSVIAYLNERSHIYIYYFFLFFVSEIVIVSNLPFTYTRVTIIFRITTATKSIEQRNRPMGT